ncbi:helix-turn-helix domain-containing protein [Proteus mirabilis]|uniref:helix-turn-helix domain-containing protein n=1 Tax=Proteus mirabilis TaxID=584 RepID=UPI0021D7ACF9|nr:helix-turn-helix domain-containing protein [Proteus mirabilis]MCU9596388.1 helix-turn-helix domain-containing protein [Proteus mirabilis]MDF7297456.1 helix-turn-helix domain-containing protein [Proteus mirabilis]
MSVFKPRILKNDNDYNEAMDRIAELMGLNPDVDSDDGNELEMIALLIEDYEKKNCHIEKPSPIEAIKFRMDQEGLTQQDMEKYLGSRSKVSEVLAGKRNLSISMITKLHYDLGIPLDVLVQKPEDIVSDNESLISVPQSKIQLYLSKMVNENSEWYQALNTAKEKTIDYSHDKFDTKGAQCLLN